MWHHRLTEGKKNWCRGARLHGSPSYMQNLHPPISCSCTATDLKGSQPHVFCCAVPPSQHYILYHQESKLRQWDRLSPASHSHSPQSGAEHNRVWKSWLKTQIRTPKTSSYKPNLQRVLHPHHLHIKDLGQERSLCPVSTWPVTASLKDALTSARQWLTTLISQGQVRSSP